jgi:hypothetical protein
METLRQLVRSSDVAGASSELSAAAALDSAADFSDARATVSGLRQPLLAKDARESRKCRADGNKSLASNELMKSKAFLTSACMYAPSNSDELAKALANRAEVSLRLASDAQGTCEHAPFARAALRDSNRAIGITRSEARVKAKALHRRGRAKHFLGLDAAAEADIATVSTGNLHSLVPETEEEHRSTEHRPLRENVYISHQSTKGRCLRSHAAAAEGELMFTELPLVGCLSKQKQNVTLRCSYCFEVAHAPIECAHCSLALYCSKSHLQLDVHEHECIEGFGWPLALPEMVRLAAKLAQIDSGEEFESAWRFIGREERIELGTYSLALSLCGVHTTATNLKALCIVRNNAFRVSPYLLDDTKLGTAIFKLASRANHSCQPNCSATFSSNAQLAFRTIESVSEGDELEITYGPERGLQALHKRQQILTSTHGFQCACRACKSAETQRTDATMVGVQCIQCADGAISLGSGQLPECYNCGARVSYESSRSAEAAIDDARSEIQIVRSDATSCNARRRIASALQLLEQAGAHRLNRLRAEANDTLAFIEHENGDLKESLQAVGRALTVLEAHCANESLALANERAKAAEIAEAAGVQERASELAFKACKVFDAHYGIENRHPRSAQLAKLIESS